MLYTREQYYIPIACRNKILSQLASGTYFTLSIDEWHIESGKDYNAHILFYRDVKGHVHIKMTNDDRRKLIRYWTV